MLTTLSHIVDPHTQALINQIESAKEKYIARYRGIDWEVFPKVFFPLSDSSLIDGITGEDIRDYNGKRVLDVGSGTGIMSVIAGLSRAKEVVAVDINEDAVRNTRANVKRYNLQEKVKVLQSDLFQKIDGDFDVIIGYLPLVSHEITEDWQRAIFDPDFSLHKRFFRDVERHLKPAGIIKMVHSSKGDVPFFESLIYKNGFKVFKKKFYYRFGLSWHSYDLQRRKNEKHRN